jgi:transcription-repair coupling factor (superfamily II helicase)
MLPPPIPPGKRYTLPLPPGSADALLLARHAQAQAAQGRLLAVVTADPADALRLDDELRFFAPALRVVVFPDWETLPYDHFSPHQDLVSQRLDALWRLHRATRTPAAARPRLRPDDADAEAHAQGVDVLLVPAATALQRLAPPAFLAAYTFDLRQRQRLDEAALKAQLTLAGYNHVS